MLEQDIYTVEDTVRCPEVEGEPIREYLRETFSRLAPKVISVGLPIDWLVVKSSGLGSVVTGSQNFFDKMFEEALRPIVKPPQRISVIKNEGIICGGAISNKDIEEWIRGRLGKDFKANYLNDPDLSFYGFVGYHLDMR
jgi:hypothetical protein